MQNKNKSLKAAGFPDELDILGHKFKVIYSDTPSDIDSENRRSLWGQYDPWETTIRIYCGKRDFSDIWHTLWHEIMHVLADQLHFLDEEDEEGEERMVDIIALGVSSVCMVNQLNFAK